MCGIFGIVTKNQEISVGKVVFEGIKRLEYRGYDSCGIVSLSNSKLFIKKEAGKIDDIHKKVKLDEFPSGSKLALAHTRWATHGAPTKQNSHPHLDCLSKIAVVHNGIIENFLELRDELTSLGHIFKSETDSEVIPHLIEDFMKKGDNLKVATINALKKCKGAYAIAVCQIDYPDLIIVARKESPLIIGIEEGKTTYCSSDIPAFLPYTKKCYIMEDNELAVLKAGEVTFFDLNKPNALRLTMKISEQLLSKFANALLSADNIYITAAGTSYHAALAGKFIISRFLGKNIQDIECSEFETQLTGSLVKRLIRLKRLGGQKKQNLSKS